MVLNGLEENATKWLRNKAEIGYTARVIFDGNAVSISIQNAPRKYLKAIRELGSKLIADGISVISETFAFAVDAKDAEKETKRTQNFILEHKESLLNLLLSDGCDAFLDAVNQDVSVLKFQYEASTMVRTSEGWQKWDGSMLCADGWKKVDGTVYADALSLSFTKIPDAC